MLRNKYEIFFKKREKNVRTNSFADKSLNRSLLYTFAEETKNKTKKKANNEHSGRS